MAHNNKETHIWNKEAILKTAREKKPRNTKDKPNRFIPDFSMETLNAKMTEMDVLQIPR